MPSAGANKAGSADPASEATAKGHGPRAGACVEAGEQHAGEAGGAREGHRLAQALSGPWLASSTETGFHAAEAPAVDDAPHSLASFFHQVVLGLQARPAVSDKAPVSVALWPGRTPDRIEHQRRRDPALAAGGWRSPARRCALQTVPAARGRAKVSAAAIRQL